MKLLLAGLMLAGLVGCTDYRARTGGGPSQGKVENGSGLGPAGEGNPGNAHNAGTNSKTLDPAH